MPSHLLQVVSLPRQRKGSLTRGLHSPPAWPSQHLITLDTIFCAGRQLGQVGKAMGLVWEAPGTLGQSLQTSQALVSIL